MFVISLESFKCSYIGLYIDYIYFSLSILVLVKSDAGRAMLEERCWESDARKTNLNVHKRMLNYGLQSISLSNQNDIRVRFSSHSVGMGYWFDK